VVAADIVAVGMVVFVVVVMILVALFSFYFDKGTNTDYNN
jgi:hypothetical protein